MKRITGTVLAAMLAVTLCGCTDSGGSAPAATDTPAPTQDLSVYEKSDGKLEKEVWYNANGLRFSTVSYEYDGSGRLVKETTLGINDEPVGYKEYTLGESGLVETMVNYTADGPEEYSEEYRVLYEYNETGLKMKETNMIGGSVTAVTTYAYEGKSLVSEKYYESSELVSDISYEYGGSGELTRLTRNDMLEGGTTVESYSYGEDGFLAKKESSVDGSLVNSTEYSYDGHGNELSVSVYGPDGAAISITKNEYEYDEPGNIIKCTRSSAGGERSTVIEYTWSYVKG